MSPRGEVLLWAQRVIAKHGAPAHQILDLPASATVEDATNAFHKIARSAHPDLHRTSLSPEELELVTTAYARAAGAYQEFRSQAMATTRMRPIKTDEMPAISRTTSGQPTAAPSPAGAPGASGEHGGGAMSSKAHIYYRKAEISLRKGDFKTALLQLKMAIAADPQSSFLRAALAEVQAELAKQP
ncbi:MAG: hypothetical protein AB7O24_11610 [Kofleriaceae bacterium]